MIDLSFIHKHHEYAGKPVMIFGLARSGFAALRALQTQDIETFVYDDNSDTRKMAEEYGAIWIDNPIDFDFSTLGFLMLAPGIPLYYPKPHPICEKARIVNCPILSDIELFGLAKKKHSTIIGITGTNGKSTTTALTEHMLRALGKNALCGGNIGVPVLALPDVNNTIYVLELSSFQLDLCPRFRPDVAVLLNITPDHLDRHKDIEGYIHAKSIMFDGCQTGIIVSDDKFSQKLEQTVKAENLIKESFENLSIPLDNLPDLNGDHNAQNITAVYQICKAVIPDMNDKNFRAALETFAGLPHRQEIIPSENNCLLFINDSKATNPDATAVALDTYPDIYWIAGGRSKDPKDFDALIKNHGQNIRHAFLIGEATDDLKHYLSKYNIPVQQCDVLNNAFSQAVKFAKRGGYKKPSIVFSPACASFDQFLNFEKRGDNFRDLVIQFNQKKSA